MQLTPEQLEKAARIAYETWYEGHLSWGESSEVHKEDMRKAITAAFAAVEPPQVDVPGDLVETMLAVFFERHWPLYREETTPEAYRKMLGDMTAALRVGLEDPRVLGEPKADGAESLALDNKCFEAGVHVAVKQFLASRRVRLLQPKTAEERVTITLQEGDFPYVVSVDGKKISAFGYEHSRDGSGAADFRLSLIAKLKAEGTVSREAGGNAQ